MQQIKTNTTRKHQNKPLPTISSKCHLVPRNVCFPIGKFVSMSSTYQLMTNFCVIWVKLMKLYCKRPALTSQFDVSKLQNQLQSVQFRIVSKLQNVIQFRPVCRIWFSTHKGNHDSKPQRCVQQHKTLNMT